MESIDTPGLLVVASNNVVGVIVAGGILFNPIRGNFSSNSWKKFDGQVIIEN